MFAFIINKTNFILVAITMYIRFLQVREILKAHNYPIRHHQINKVSFIIGIFACFGLCIVANFQETAMLIIHWFGAILLFALGALYQCCQVNFFLLLFKIIIIEICFVFLDVHIFPTLSYFRRQTFERFKESFSSGVKYFSSDFYFNWLNSRKYI